jgi:hypothetical protein
MPKTSPSHSLLDDILAWRDTPAKADVRALPTVNVPALGRLRRALPENSAARLLSSSYKAALRISQPTALLRRTGSTHVGELAQRPLSESHAHARRIARQSGWLAGGSGALFGVAGAAGLAADAPSLLILSLRALIRIGYCYGETPSPALTTALFALASADTEAEKQLAWRAALQAPRQLTDQDASAAISDAALRDGLERAAEREFAKQALATSAQRLAATLARRLGMKKAAGALPFVGAAVGGAVNIRFMYLLTEAARMAYAARWHLANDPTGDFARQLLPTEIQDAPLAALEQARAPKPSRRTKRPAQVKKPSPKQAPSLRTRAQSIKKKPQ